MTKAAFFLVIFLAVSGCNKSNETDPIIDKSLASIINESKKCESSEKGKECIYQFGNYLKVSIAAVGSEFAGIHFEKSNSDSPIYASFGLSHGCVILNRFEGFKGMPEWVFISPKNGGVYKTWQDCVEAK